MKKVLAIFAVMVLVFAVCTAFSACSGDKAKNEDKATEAAAETEAETPTQAPTEASTKAPVTVVKEAEPITVNESIEEGGITVRLTDASESSKVNMLGAVNADAAEGLTYITLYLEISNNGTSEFEIEASDFSANTDAGTASFAMMAGGGSVSPGGSCSVVIAFSAPEEWNELEMKYVNPNGTAFFINVDYLQARVSD